MRQVRRVFAAALCASAWLPASAELANGVDPQPAKVVLPRSEERVAYEPPTGFAGLLWGDSFAKIAERQPKVVAADVAYAKERVTQVEFFCTPTQTGCDLYQALASLRQETARGGFRLLMEVVIPDQGFRFPQTGVVMYPVTYQFCAQWQGQTSKPPESIIDEMELCGIRMVFRSETLQEAEDLPEDRLTTYELVLEQLIRRYGKPTGYFKQERVVVDTGDGKYADPRQRRFKTWRWCPPVGFTFVPSCEASIVLGFNPESGNGAIFYVTAPVWEFALAREQNVKGSDPLYRLLHARER